MDPSATDIDQRNIQVLMLAIDMILRRIPEEAAFSLLCMISLSDFRIRQCWRPGIVMSGHTFNHISII